MSDDSYRPVPASRALRRAQVIVYGPLLSAMAVMLLAGYRVGLSIYRLADTTVYGGLGAVGVVVGVFVAIWIAGAISVHPHKAVVAAWLLGCGMSLILGLTLGSWP